VVAVSFLWLAAPAGAGITYKEKAADETVTSSSTLQDDDELFFTTTSGTLYDVRATINYASPAGGGTPDLKMLWSEDSTRRGYCFSFGDNATDGATTNVLSSQSTATAFVRGTAANKRATTINCTIVGNGGTFKLQWAQDTSGANGTTIYAGSWLSYSTGVDQTIPWGSVTGKPDFDANYCNADGSEADPDCVWAEVGSVAPVLTQNEHDALNLVWYGVWALVGLMFILILAPVWFRAWGIEGKLGRG